MNFQQLMLSDAIMICDVFFWYLFGFGIWLRDWEYYGRLLRINSMLCVVEKIFGTLRVYVTS